MNQEGYEEVLERGNNEMFQFYNQFDELSDDIVSLKIIEKYPGNEVVIPFYYYDIYENKTHQKVGKISIRIGENYHSYYNGHIGYEIDEEYRGHKFSFYAAQLVLQVAKEHKMKYVYITCNETNEASKKVIEYLGGELIEIASIPKDYFGWYDGVEPHCIYKKKL